jgi:hypothetical protein
MLKVFSDFLNRNDFKIIDKEDVEMRKEDKNIVDYLKDS